MVGKKVFSQAGEYLAEFLTQRAEEDSQSQKVDIINIKLDEILNESSVNSSDEDKYLNIFQMSKEETMTYIKESLTEQLSLSTITNGIRDIPVDEMVQTIYNKLQYTDAKTSAQFKSIIGFLSVKFADIIKTVGSNYRQTNYNITQLNNKVSEQVYKALDYYIGGPEDKKRVYYKFVGNRLMVADGLDAAQQFIEVLRTNTVAQGGQAVASDSIMIGGATEDKIKKIFLNKETTINGNLNMTNGEINGVVVAARYNDLAELYTAPNIKDISAGLLMMINPDDSDDACQLIPHDGTNSIIGIISSTPGFILNTQLTENSVNDPNKLIKQIVPIALTGQVPIQMSCKTKKGDYIYQDNLNIGKCIAISFDNREVFELASGLKPIAIALETNSIDYDFVLNNKVLCKLI